MKILLDENMPHKLVVALRAEGHNADSVHTLHLDGTSNGALLRRASSHYDLVFTRDADFAVKARQSKPAIAPKVLCVTLAQQPQETFVAEFVRLFRRTNWSDYRNGDDWP